MAISVGQWGSRPQSIQLGSQYLYDNEDGDEGMEE